jgi:hypothetical protein
VPELHREKTELLEENASLKKGLDFLLAGIFGLAVVRAEPTPAAIPRKGLTTRHMSLVLYNEALILTNFECKNYQVERSECGYCCFEPSCPRRN